MANLRLETDSLSTLHWVAIVLTAITGVVHLGLGVSFDNPAMFVAAAGFFGAIVLVLLGVRRRLLYLLGIPFTAGQFVLYFVFNWPDVLSPVGIGDKVVQVVLIVVLAVLYRRETGG